MAYISDADWAKYREIINSVHDDFNQDNLTWRRANSTQVALFNEQAENNYTDIVLKALVGYNFFRTWPMTRHSESGELDNQNMVVYLNRDYLSKLGYLTPEGHFNYRPDKDTFIHRGIEYKCEGDTLLAQAKDTPLLIMLILRREELKTGDTPFQYGN